MKITNVHAISLDGAIASSKFENDQTRLNYGLTSQEDQLRVQGLLKTADAVITGSSSLVSAGKAWEVQNKSGKYVSWFVLTNSGLPLSLPFWQQSNLDRYLVSESALTPPFYQDYWNKGAVKNIVYHRHHPAEYLVGKLKEMGMQSLLLFGGGSVNKLFFERNLVTDLEYTICPVLLGGEKRVNILEPGLLHPSRAKLSHSQVKGDHLFLSYKMLNVNSIISER